MQQSKPKSKRDNLHSVQNAVKRFRFIPQQWIMSIIPFRLVTRQFNIIPENVGGPLHIVVFRFAMPRNATARGKMQYWV